MTLHIKTIGIMVVQYIYICIYIYIYIYVCIYIYMGHASFVSSTVAGVGIGQGYVDYSLSASGLRAQSPKA